MKKIGFFNSIKTWGGGEKWYYDATKYFLNKGFEVHFFLTKDSELHNRLMQFENVIFHFVKISNLSFINPFKQNKLNKIFANIGINHLIINLSKDLKIAAYSAKKANINRIIYLRTIPIPIKNTFLNRYIFNNFLTDIIVNSKATKESILNNNNKIISENKIKVIYNPINCDEFINRPFELLYKKNPEEIVIGSLGRLTSEKNHKFLIYLSIALNKNNIKHKILIGGKGALENELISLINENSLNDNIIMAGFIDNVKDLLCSCDIFVLPSLFEGFGYAIVEAFLCELPIIAFNTTSIPEIVQNNESGYIIDINSIEQAVEKINILQGNISLRQEMGIIGKKFVIKNFSENVIMNQLSIYLFS